MTREADEPTFENPERSGLGMADLVLIILKFCLNQPQWPAGIPIRKNYRTSLIALPFLGKNRTCIGEKTADSFQMQKSDKKIIGLAWQLS
jgi:hypothetical protein